MKGDTLNNIRSINSVVEQDSFREIIAGGKIYSENTQHNHRVVFNVFQGFKLQRGGIAQHTELLKMWRAYFLRNDIQCYSVFAVQLRYSQL